MARTRNTDTTRKDIDTPLDSATTCALCDSQDPQIRGGHQLHTARAGLDALRVHLQRFSAQRVDTDRRRGYVDDICRWVADEMKTWSGLADEQTGRPLAWWEARNQAHAQKQKPHEYEKGQEPAWTR